MKIKEILTVTGIVLIVGVFTVYYAEQRIWNYDNSVYQLKLGIQQYDFSNPKQRWDLPKELKEISGLSFYKKNQLACVQDEEGVLYVYDLKKETVIRSDKFGKKGDYEAVEVVDDTAYILKSNGEIYYFHVKPMGIGDVNKINTELTNKNDTEGLGFNKSKNELLIACKEEPGTKEVELEKSRSVYSVHQPDKKFIQNPKYVIESKSYNEMLEKKGLDKKAHKPFKPSGIAVHPKTNYVFIIGTVGKIMVILTPEGAIADLVPLDPGLFAQPEGICFSPEGDLYISSEGKRKKGYILKF